MLSVATVSEDCKVVVAIAVVSAEVMLVTLVAAT